MKRIEFIGASYVGKSTLLQEIEKRHRSSKVVSERDMLFMSRKKIGYIRFMLRKIVEKTLSYMKIKYDAYGFPSYESISAEQLENYKESFMLCFSKEAQESFDFKFLFETHKRVFNIISKLIFFNKIEEKKYLLAEESILHWHLVLHELFLDHKIVLQEKHFKDYGLVPEAIVCCYADEQTIKHRLRLRSTENRTNKNHIEQSEDQVVQSILRKQGFFVDYSKLLKDKGIPVLFVDTSADLNLNVMRLEEFIETV